MSWGKVGGWAGEEEVIASGQISSREGKEGGTRQGGGGGRGGQLSEERGSLSLSASFRFAGYWSPLPPVFSGSLAAAGCLEEFSCVLAACLDLNMDSG